LILEQPIGLAKNKVGKSGKFFGGQISGIFAPRFTTQLPQTHQQITIKKHTIFQNPLQKSPQNSQNSQLSAPDFFLSNSNPKNPLPAKSKIRTI
jgi:hypothetical protein